MSIRNQILLCVMTPLALVIAVGCASVQRSEALAYKEATEKNQPGLYQHFLDKYPMSIHQQEVKLKLQQAKTHLRTVKLRKRVLIELDREIPNAPGRPERRIAEYLREALTKRGFDTSSVASSSPDVRITIGEIGATIPAGSIGTFSLNLGGQLAEPSQVVAYYHVPFTLYHLQAGYLCLQKDIRGQNATGPMWGGQAEAERLASLNEELENEIVTFFSLFSLSE